MAFSKITTRGMSGDTLEAGDIAANAIGASELADNAVDTAAIAATSITEAKLNADITDGSAIQTGVKPHIRPGTLYPAWSGLLDNHTGYTFTDSSASGHTLTPSGGLHHSGAQSKVGSTALKFDGTNDIITIADHADFDSGATSTLEAWIYVTGFPSSGWAPIFSSGDFTGSSTAGWSISSWNAGSTPKMGVLVNNTWNNSGSSELPTNQWVHIAVVRAGGDYKVYMNGTLGHSFTYATNLVTGTSLIIGQSKYSGTHRFQGYMDGIRITQGVAVYTGNFTPPTSLTTTWSAGTNIAANSTASNVKLLINSDNGGHSGAYGTAQSDGHSYYYTDIKGSKPIKDPRIGAHFGSQRHKFKSLQLLEQETATHGENVFSIDGREWMRSITGLMDNGSHGLGMYWESSTVAGVIEIVGYFSDANLIAQTRSGTARSFTWAIDGGSSTTDNSLECTVDNPLRSRYVDAGSVVNLGCGATLGVHTLKLSTPAVSGDTPDLNGIELIAQDTSSTANKSKIQIPSQNVVSYGKKFTVSGTPHYNPFDGMSGAKTLAQLGDYIDTATSLGMDNWKAGTSNYYKPFNGGRVVKWVDSSGAIKTSVTMMPPNAQNMTTTASNAFSDGEVQAGTNDHTITFNTSAIDHSLSEVAKTFHWREFGNGAANTGGSGSWADTSMLTTTDDAISYVMDDGLTSLSHGHAEALISGGNEALSWDGDSDRCTTFIGTGISISSRYEPGTGYGSFNKEIAMNLPYGTHIFKDESSSKDKWIDGVEIKTGGTDSASYGTEWTFYQPKKPPIPEDAVVLADYMLMADFVAQTSVGEEYISKGTRSISCSRDFMHTGSSNHGFGQQVDGGMGFAAMDIAESGGTWKLPTFSTNFVVRGYQTDTKHNLYLDGVDKDSAATKDNTAAYGSFSYITTSYEVGLHLAEHRRVSGNANWSLYDIVTPTHTSSHYQTFETPYLKELVGGDRNMEQTNLVVTPDGKSWDEVTRDTSYLGKTQFYTIADMTDMSGSTVPVPFDLFRGVYVIDAIQKDFAIAYDRFICLVDGMYNITASGMEKSIGGGSAIKIYINGVDKQTGSGGGANDLQSFNICTFPIQLKRGDYVQLYGWNLEGNNANYSPRLQITKE